MKIVVLGNQARSVANFWSVLMRRMRGAGHEVICMVPAGDVATEGRLAALGACPADAPGFPKAPALRIVNYPLDRKGLNPLGLYSGAFFQGIPARPPPEKRKPPHSSRKF